MIGTIKQCWFSRSVSFFQQGFMAKWNLTPYHDINAPAVFIGVYRPEDILAINNHKGFKLVVNTGKLRDIFFEINPQNVIVTATMGGLMDYTKRALLSSYDYVHSSFPIKDFSSFNPTPLGDKVYCYLGNESGKHIMGYEIAEEVRKKTHFDVIIGMQGHTIEYVKENFYNQSFINLKPSITGGLTGACELAYMGRLTISNSDAPFCIPYNSIDDILAIIEQESKKIGTIQPSYINNFFTTGEEWKNIEFWLLGMDF